MGPFLVTKHFLPLLMKKNTRVVVNSSSICGSISATVSGGIGGENPLASVLLPYNTSKAALNMRKRLQPPHHMRQSCTPLQIPWCLLFSAAHAVCQSIADLHNVMVHSIGCCFEWDKWPHQVYMKQHYGWVGTYMSLMSVQCQGITCDLIIP